MSYTSFPTLPTDTTLTIHSSVSQYWTVLYAQGSGQFYIYEPRFGTKWVQVPDYSGQSWASNASNYLFLPFGDMIHVYDSGNSRLYGVYTDKWYTPPVLNEYTSFYNEVLGISIYSDNKGSNRIYDPRISPQDTHDFPPVTIPTGNIYFPSENQLYCLESSSSSDVTYFIIDSSLVKIPDKPSGHNGSIDFLLSDAFFLTLNNETGPLYILSEPYTSGNLQWINVPDFSNKSWAMGNDIAIEICLFSDTLYAIDNNSLSVYALWNPRLSDWVPLPRDSGTTFDISWGTVYMTDPDSNVSKYWDPSVPQWITTPYTGVYQNGMILYPNRKAYTNITPNALDYATNYQPLAPVTQTSKIPLYIIILWIVIFLQNKRRSSDILLFLFFLFLLQ